MMVAIDLRCDFNLPQC